MLHPTPSNLAVSELWELRTKTMFFVAFSWFTFCGISSLRFLSGKSYAYLLLNGVPGKATTSDWSPHAFTNCFYVFGQTHSPSFPQHLQLSALAVDNFGVSFPFKKPEA